MKGAAEEKDELTDSMNKLNVEASSSGQMGHSSEENRLSSSLLEWQVI